MTQKIKIFGATPSPYTQKILAAFRYRHIPFMIYNGDIAKKITKLGIELPKPVLLPTILLPNDNGVFTIPNFIIVRNLLIDYFSWLSMRI